jgi:xylulokinase
MDPEVDWWGAALEVIRRLVRKLGSRSSDILGVGICGMVPCMCLLDEDGSPLRPAILYSDNRALAELDWVNRRTGLELTAQAVTPKLLWVQAHEPEIFARTRLVLSAHHFVVRRLTGRAWMDYDTASILGGIFRPQSKVYDKAVLKLLGLPESIWPDLLPAVNSAGEITPWAAAQTGLLEGTTVLVGSGDTFPTIIGCGAVDPGDAMIALGTTGLLTVTERPLLDSVMGPHFDDGSGQAAVTWAAMLLSAGELAGWYTRQFEAFEGIPGGLGANPIEFAVKQDAVPGGVDWFALLEKLAERVPAGAEGLLALPHWLGRRTPLPNAGLRGALIGLTPSHTSGHIYRALMEAVAFNMRQGFDPLRAGVKRVVATGGGSVSPLWRQILADVLETEIEHYPSASGALGMAFLAAWAGGSLHEFDTVKQKWLGDGQISRPDPGEAAAYRSSYAAYQHFEQALEQAYDHR